MRRAELCRSRPGFPIKQDRVRSTTTPVAPWGPRFSTAAAWVSSEPASASTGPSTSTETSARFAGPCSPSNRTAPTASKPLVSAKLPATIRPVWLHGDRLGRHIRASEALNAPARDAKARIAPASGRQGVRHERRDRQNCRDHILG
jgi:hypothetical protein